MSTVLDQLGDTDYRELHYFSKLYDFPDYVRKAPPSTTLLKAAYESSPGHLFANTRNRSFPVNTKAATWLSSLFFVEKRDSLSDKEAAVIEDRLDKAAKYHGIVADVKAIVEKHAELYRDRENERPDADYAIVWAAEDGSKERHYPLRNGKEVQAAAQWLQKNRDNAELTYGDRRVISNKILDKAAELGALLNGDTDEFLQKQAGRATYNPKAAAAMIRDRVKAAGTKLKPEVKIGLLKAADTVEANPHLALEPNNVRALCEMLDTFDRDTRLNTKYGSVIPRPEDVLCAGVLKQAAEFISDACVLTNGSMYKASQFSHLGLEDVKDAFGNNVAAEVSAGVKVSPEKMAEIAGTFPLREANTLDALMDSVGQRALMKEAMSIDRDKSRLSEMSQLYQTIRTATS